MLEKIEEDVQRDAAKKKKKKKYPKGAKTSIAKDVRARKRQPPVVPEGMSLAEIRALDPDDPRLKHKTKKGTKGRPRKHDGKKKEDLEWTDSVRQGKQKRTNDKRAKVRKHEAEVIATVTELKSEGTKIKRKEDPDLDDETILIEEGYLSLDDWDTEELVRGYRRGRSGKFGKPPRYVPRELQQEILRRLLRRGERKLHMHLIKAIEDLIDLAENSTSDKVRLEATREVINRVVGKVPERINIAADAPYQDMLADSLVPISDIPPLELEVGVDGVARAEPLDDDEDGTFERGGRDA
jgi:hypothetical protein